MVRVLHFKDVAFVSLTAATAIDFTAGATTSPS